MGRLSAGGVVIKLQNSNICHKDTKKKKKKSECRTCIEEVKELETQEPNINNELPIQTEGSGSVI
jgi:hypothetical protein